MQYTVTIVEVATSGHRYIIGAHRAAVEHLFQSYVDYGTLLVVGDGTLCMPEPPLSLASVAGEYIIDSKRLAEALDIDAAMRGKPTDSASAYDKGGRCTKPSTQMHGGGYIEVCCMCDEHADASPRAWNWRRIRPDEGALTTGLGLQKDRRRCQFVRKSEVQHAE